MLKRYFLLSLIACLSSQVSAQQLTVTTTAALEALPLTGLSANDIVIKTGYYTAIDMPQVGYYLMTSDCDLDSGAGDLGAEIPSNTAHNCWHITAQTAYDLRWWGATPITRIAGATVSGSPGPSSTITVAGAQFTAADYTPINKYIVITDTNSADGSVLPGTTYQGNITGWTNSTTVTVSAGSGSFNTSYPQNVIYGFDNSQAINNALAYATNQASGGNNYVEVTGGGQAYGVVNSINYGDNIVWKDTEITALASANFTIANGLVVPSTASSHIINIFANSDYLPVNGFYVGNNGNNEMTSIIAQDWWGNIATYTATGPGGTGVTSSAGSIVLVLSSTDYANVHTGMFVVNSDIPKGDAIVVSLQAGTSLCSTYCAVISKVVGSSWTNQNVVFADQPSGLRVGNGSNGVHVNGSSLLQEWSNASIDNGYAGSGGKNAHAGTPYYDAGYGGSTLATTLLNSGNVGAFFDTTHHGGNGTQLNQDNIFPSWDPHIDSAQAIVIADGAQKHFVTGGFMGGVIRLFAFNGNVPSLGGVGIISNAASQYNNDFVIGNPNDLVQIVTNTTNVVTSQLTLWPTSLGQTTDTSPYTIGMGGISNASGKVGACGSDYSYAGYSCSDLTAMAVSQNTAMINGSLFLGIGNLNLGGGTITTDGGEINTVGGALSTGGGAITTGGGTLGTNTGTISTGGGAINTVGGTINTSGGLLDLDGGVITNWYRDHTSMNSTSTFDTATNCGSVILISNNSPQTITLPDVSAIGCSVQFYARAHNQIIQAGGSALLNGTSGGSVTITNDTMDICTEANFNTHAYWACK